MMAECSGGPQAFWYFGYFRTMSISEQTIDRAFYNSHRTIKLWFNKEKLFHLIFTTCPNYQLALNISTLKNLSCMVLNAISVCNKVYNGTLEVLQRSEKNKTQLLKSGAVSHTLLLERFLIWGSSLLKALCTRFFGKMVIHNLSVSSSPIDDNNFTELQWTICLAFWIIGVLLLAGYCSYAYILYRKVPGFTIIIFHHRLLCLIE